MASAINQKLLEDKRRFAAWRRNRKKRGPVPPELWQRALAHIGELGLNRVSREFRLNYTQLKRKAQQGQQPVPGHRELRPERRRPKRALHRAFDRTWPGWRTASGRAYR